MKMLSSSAALFYVHGLPGYRADHVLLVGIQGTFTVGGDQSLPRFSLYASSVLERSANVPIHCACDVIAAIQY